MSTYKALERCDVYLFRWLVPERCLIVVTETMVEPHGQRGGGVCPALELFETPVTSWKCT
jgi:hypothetical protein